MIRPGQITFLLTALAVIPLQAQLPPAPHPGSETNLSVLMPPKQTAPVAQFRELLAMTPAARNQSLSNRPPEVRTRILGKVREYLALAPDERELRLRATELRWYLSPLFRTPPDERGHRLEQVPAELRSVVQSRLAQWDILPPQIQKELLASDRPLHYFASMGGTNAAAQSLEQQKISDQFNQFFEFTPEEKVQALGTLSESERQQMESTLNHFEQLPLAQRRLCLKNFAKFAGMTATERSEFLKNAEQWSKMSPTERQSWRDLVSNVPQWPPLPPAPTGMPANLIPPGPSPKFTKPGVATN